MFQTIKQLTTVNLKEKTEQTRQIFVSKQQLKINYELNVLQQKKVSIQNTKN